jgi:ABC-type amino acid transport substrate-binding protein
MRKSRLLAALIVVSLLLATAVLAVGCGDDDDDQGAATTTGQLDTLSEGKLTVGSDIPYAPFEFGDPPDYDGFDIQLVDEIGKRLNLDVTYVKTPFDVVFRNLAQGRFDMVVSASTITDERKRTVDFSDPYFAADQSLMIKEPSDIRTVDDITGKIVGAQLGTTGAAYAKDKTDAEEVRTYDLIDDAFKALETGQVAAVINDCPVSKYAERSKPDLKVVQLLVTGENYGMAFQKGSDAIREAVNGALAEVKKDGTYKKLYTKWFGSDPCKSILERQAAAGP